MSNFNGFQSPNHTQAPNEFFDLLLSKIETMGELKVTLAAIRQTFGWHRTQAELSVGFLEKATGMSRNSVRQGIKDAIERGTLIEVRPETNKDGAIYAMAMSDDVAKHTVGGSTVEVQKLTPTNRGSNNTPQRGGGIAPQNLTPNKESNLKEKKERDVPTENANSENPVILQPPQNPVGESGAIATSDINPDVGASKTKIQTSIKSLFHVPYDFDWTWFDALFAENPDEELHLDTAQRLFDLGTPHSQFDPIAYTRVLRAAYGRKESAVFAKGRKMAVRLPSKKAEAVP